jgi:uncharacterized protein YraI
LLELNRSAVFRRRRLTASRSAIFATAALALTVALLSPARTPAHAAGKARVTSPDGLNLRDAPSTSGNVIEVLPYNRSVDVLAGPIQQTWYEVSDNGTLGYARADFLDFSSAPAPQAGVDALVTPADGVHLRAGPSQSSAAAGVLLAGTVVHVTGAATSDGWYPVQSNLGSGWVDGQYLQVVQAGGGPVKITYYGHEFDGGVLACGGGYYSADDPTVAAAVGWPCGAHLHVCAGSSCVDVIVKDRGRMGLGAVDLSQAAFQKLASPAAGTVFGSVTVATSQ